ncbi:hypothetical protein ACEWY4_023454 [Coilia grayii]|uniref:DEP domain-containing protein n=1 Tax=Coilia grayii TaxID=363190 RepID=A0ABD1J4P4_9TELE
MSVPPAPPPPPTFALANTEKPSLNKSEQRGRNALLSDISKGKRLKKAITNDRSAPVLGRKNALPVHEVSRTALGGHQAKVPLALPPGVCPTRSLSAPQLPSLPARHPGLPPPRAQICLPSAPPPLTSRPPLPRHLCVPPQCCPLPAPPPPLTSRPPLPRHLCGPAQCCPLPVTKEKKPSLLLQWPPQPPALPSKPANATVCQTITQHRNNLLPSFPPVPQEQKHPPRPPKKSQSFAGHDRPHPVRSRPLPPLPNDRPAPGTSLDSWEHRFTFHHVTDLPQPEAYVPGPKTYPSSFVKRYAKGAISSPMWLRSCKKANPGSLRATMDDTSVVFSQKLNLSAGSNDTSPSAMSIDKLLPALLECFGIILCGYIAGRANIITPTQSKGLGNFVSKFALPALLFKNMVLLDFGDVIWPFLWSILIAKVSIFCVVCVLTLLVANRDSRFSKAGLFSIFATQSNDFALGYPIVEALYRNTHPEYLQYIYLVAPVSLILLNPLGFALCEVQRWQSNHEQPRSKLQVAGTVALQVSRNPIVFMVVVGLAAHFLLGRKIPPFMEQFVDGLANSFGGAALFYLGLTMVGQMRRLTRSTVVALILLITAKLLVMPLVCRDMVEVLDWGNSSALNHSSLANYAFLYGVFPTAPSVAIYAAHYGMELEVVTSGMVISTFLSAPIMYVSAWLLTIPSMEPSLSVAALQTVSFDISIISLVALVWTIAVMFLSKKFKRLPHLFTVNMLVAQLLACIGMITWNFTVEQGNFLGQTLTFTLLYGSLYSTYVWPGLIALSLVFMRKKGELKISPGFVVIAGWGVPCFVVGILLIAGQWSPESIDSAFFYGTSQIITTAVVLFCSIVLAGGSLISLSREYRTLRRGSASDTPEDTRPLSEPEDQIPPPTVEPPLSAEGINGVCQMCDCVPPQPMPDMIVSTNMIDAPHNQPGVCGTRCESSGCLLVQEEESRRDSDTQVARHALLCLLLLVSLLANLSSCLWWLFHQEPGRLYLELQFFCVILNYGQGFISFGLFGLDKHLIILPFKKRVTRLWRGRGGADDPSPSRLPEEVRLTCTQFTRYHQEQCIRDIVQRKRCGERSVASTFLGSDLVEWLMRVGLARDRGEAVVYGSRLHEGGVLQHITHNYCFQDDNLHYRFTDRTTPHAPHGHDRPGAYRDDAD